MKYRKLGKTGIEVSEIGYGAWALGGAAEIGGRPFGYSAVDEKACLDALALAVDKGVNFIDTADVYGLGHSERLVGKFVRGRRDKIVIATKGGGVPDRDERWWVDCSYPHLIAAAHHSLKRLQTDYIDVYQLHSPPEKVPWDDVFKAFDDLKREGKVRAAGVSISFWSQGEELAGSGQVDVLQVLYNLFDQEHAKKTIPAAVQSGIGIIARVPLAYGLLSGKYSSQSTFAEDDWRQSWPSEYREKQLKKVSQLKFLVRPPVETLSQASLAFILSNKGVSTVIPGMKNTRQVEDNLHASQCHPLPNEDLKRIQEIYPTWEQGPRVTRVGK